ncbi:hypothetical protein BSKO_05591 [Bryopsis sp. KO-2023]|nr:hypothetical protein BSKO_05591 [Bryopsis sp. KO-2023]
MATTRSSLDLGCGGLEPHGARRDLLARLKRAKDRQVQLEREEEKMGLLAKKAAPKLASIPENEAVGFEPRTDGPPERKSWKYVRWGFGILGALGVAGILVTFYTKREKKL